MSRTHHCTLQPQDQYPLKCLGMSNSWPAGQIWSLGCSYVAHMMTASFSLLKIFSVSWSSRWLPQVWIRPWRVLSLMPLLYTLQAHSLCCTLSRASHKYNYTAAFISTSFSLNTKDKASHPPEACATTASPDTWLTAKLPDRLTSSSFETDRLKWLKDWHKHPS